MLVLVIILLVLGAGSLAFYLIEKCKGYSIKEVLMKSVVSFLFLAVATVSAFSSSGHILNPFIILGLLLGLLGDIFLDLKYVYPKDDKPYTLAGFLVFGIGHILYVVGMFAEFLGDAHVLYVVIPLAVAVVLAVANLFLAKPLGLDFKELKWVVFGYSMLLFSTPLSALSLCIANGFANASLIMLFIGGILFALSDLVLSKTYFSKGHEKSIDFILNYVFYYGAQFLIACSLFFL